MASDLAGNHALSETTGETATQDAAAVSPAPGRVRGLLHFTLPGSYGAVLFAAMSFTPSLLPRGGFVQGLICGITAAIGYGLGVLAAWLWRALSRPWGPAPAPPPRRGPRSWGGQW